MTELIEAWPFREFTDMAASDDNKPKPAADGYVALLFVSVAATVLAIGLLALSLNKYDWVSKLGG